MEMMKRICFGLCALMLVLPVLFCGVASLGLGIAGFTGLDFETESEAISAWSNRHVKPLFYAVVMLFLAAVAFFGVLCCAEKCFGSND